MSELAGPPRGIVTSALSHHPGWSPVVSVPSEPGDPLAHTDQPDTLTPFRRH
jgi:hypothetical protein